MNQLYIPVKEREENVFVKCKCGCGKEFPKYTKKGYLKLFIEGHNNKGKKFPYKIGRKHSEEEKINQRLKMKEWHKKIKDTEKDKEMRKKIGETNHNLLIGRKLSQEHKEHVIIALKINSKNPKRIENLPRGENHSRWKGGITPNGITYCKGFHINSRLLHKDLKEGAK